MSNWLYDSSTGRQVRLAPGREARPNDVSEHAESTKGCPFCAPPGEQTPPESDRVESPAGEWLVRTVPNLFPAFEGNDGVSEVVIESPDHVTRFIDLPDENASAAVTEWARRVGHWAEDPRFDFQMFFKNEGAWAGASLSHAHSQVVALNESPREAKALWDDSSDWRAGRQERTVVETDHFIAFSPKAPRFAAETWIAPQETGSEFAGLAGDAIATTKLASLLQSLLGAFSSLGIEHFNLMLQQPPRSQRTVGGSDWRIEVAPRVAMLAGFELATGAYINTISPEDSAKKLRSSMARSTEGL